jgi:hypothetical protein
VSDGFDSRQAHFENFNDFAKGFARVLKFFAVCYGLLLVRPQEFRKYPEASVSSCALLL